MNIVVTSSNPVKLKATEKTFNKVFNTAVKITPISVGSNVADQAMSDAESYQGALNRVNNAMPKIEADYYVGIEAGVEQSGNQLSSFTWVVIKSKSKLGKAKSQTYFLPEKVSKLVLEGKELGEANDIVFNKSNSKQHNGAVGLLTNDMITRDSLYEDTVLLALIPFIQSEYY